MRVVGHEDVEISRDYTHEEMAQMQAAIETIPDVFAETASQASRDRRAKSAAKPTGPLVSRDT
jgi:hypothetical protein